MSREIKFRCWDQKNKKYLLPEKQGFVILPTTPSFGATLPYENCSNPGNIDEDCIDWADADLLMGRYELEQYTGLKDKNGKEIYEGDIVKANYFESHYAALDVGKTKQITGRIQFGSGCFYISSMSDETPLFQSGGPNNVEVIGNIHEDPELLGGEE